MKKLLLIGIAVIIIIIAVLIVGISNLGPIIKNAVNTYGPQMTKTEVSLGDVNISLLSGQTKLKDFYLGNPQGFKAPSAMEVGSVFVDVDEKTLTKDTIVIERIEVLAPKITYEKKRSTDNFKTIANNVNSFIGPKESAPAQEEKEKKESPSKKILIRNFVVKDATVTLSASMLGDKSISAPLPDIHLKNVGGEGASPAKVFGEIFSSLQKSITSPAVMDTLGQGLKGIGENLKTVGETAKDQVGTIGEKAKELFVR